MKIEEIASISHKLIYATLACCKNVDYVVYCMNLAYDTQRKEAP